MRLLLLLLALPPLAGCSRSADDARPTALLETPPAVTHNPLGTDPAGVPSADSTAGTFEGYYSAGFEHAGFVPCSDTTETWWTEPAMTWTPIAGNQSRVDIPPAADVTARYTEAVGDDARTFGHGVTVFARLRGRLSPRRDVAGGAGYGHLGAYARAFAVDSVETLVRDTVATGCPAPASVRP